MTTLGFLTKKIFSRLAEAHKVKAEKPIRQKGGKGDISGMRIQNYKRLLKSQLKELIRYGLKSCHRIEQNHKLNDREHSK